MAKSRRGELDLNEYVKPFLSLEQLQKIKECFDIFDTDSSGVVSCQEFISGITALGLEHKLRRLVMVAEKGLENGTGDLSFPEFLDLLGFSKEKKQRSNEQLFDLLDRKGKGFVNIQDLRLAVKEVHAPYSEEQIQAMISAADKDKDGYISFDEFQRVLKLVKN